MICMFHVNLPGCMYIYIYGFQVGLRTSGCVLRVAKVESRLREHQDQVRSMGLEYLPTIYHTIKKPNVGKCSIMFHTCSIWDVCFGPLLVFC